MRDKISRRIWYDLYERQIGAFEVLISNAGNYPALEMSALKVKVNIEARVGVVDAIGETIDSLLGCE